MLALGLNMPDFPGGAAALNALGQRPSEVHRLVGATVGFSYQPPLTTRSTFLSAAARRTAPTQRSGASAAKIPKLN